MTEKETALYLALLDLHEAICFANAGEGHTAPIEYCKIKDKRGFLKFLAEFPYDTVGNAMKKKHDVLFDYRNKSGAHTDLATHEVIREPDSIVKINGSDVFIYAVVVIKSISSVRNIQSYVDLFQYQQKRVMDKLKDLENAKRK
jgi:hypothetical protein